MQKYCEVASFVLLQCCHKLNLYQHSLRQILTATQERAGLPVKYSLYTSLNATKSPISYKKQVVLNTLSDDEPASSSNACRFFIT